MDSEVFVTGIEVLAEFAFAPPPPLAVVPLMVTLSKPS